MSAVANLFIGREKELAELRAGLGEALGGQGRLFLISGEPGIGKTRLAEEIAGEAAAAHGVRVLWGRCWEGEGGPALWPWVQCLRSYIADCDPQALGDEVGSGGAILGQLVPEIRQKAPDLGVASLPADADQARFQLFDATVSFLRTASRRQPLLLIFDDLHGADRTTLLLMRFLTRNLRDSRILMVGAYRDVELRSATHVEEMLADLARETRFIPLGGLPLEEVRELIEAAGGEGASNSLVARVHEATNGNPFFVAEVVRPLAAEPPVKEGRRSLFAKLAVPTAVGLAIRRHLRALSESARQALAAASVIGRDFELSRLERVIGRSGPEMLGAVSEAMRAGIVSRAPESLDRYRFSHALIRETLYDEVSAAERARLHRRVGEGLESLAGSAGDLPLAELAHHYFEAAVLGESDKAIDYAKRAAEQAMRVFAYEEAARHLERAIDLLALRHLPGARERCELLLRLGTALWGFELKRSKEVLLEAARLAEEIGDAERLAWAALGLGGLYGIPGDDGSADDQQIVPLERALVALEETDTPLRARVMARLANALCFGVVGSGKRVAELAEEAVRIARLCDDEMTLAQVLAWTAAPIWGPDDDPREFVAMTREIIARATTLGDDRLAMFGRLLTVERLLEIGEFEKARHEADSASRVSLMGGDGFTRLSTLLIPGVLALVDGRFEEAAQVVQAIRAVAEETQSQVALQIFLGQAHFLRHQQGRLDELPVEIQNLTIRFPMRPFISALLAWDCAAAGKLDEARAVVATIAADDFAGIPRDSFWLVSICFVSQVVAMLRDTRSVAVLYELLLPYAPRVAIVNLVFCYGSVARTLGLLAATLSRFDEAAAHFELALETNAALGSPPWLAHTEHDYARMLLERRGPGDVEKANELAAHALATSRELGMKALEERLLALRSRNISKKIEVTFRKEGDFWAITFEGATLRLRDSKGLQHLAALVRQPRAEMHAAELAGLERGATSLGDAGEKLDQQAREQYRRRLEDLREAAEEAERFNDPTRAANARAEMEAIATELSAAFGLGGRSRRASSDAERARLMVTQRIKAALRNITEASPALGHHLGKTIRTGLFCSYEPDE